MYVRHAQATVQRSGDALALSAAAVNVGQVIKYLQLQSALFSLRIDWPPLVLVIFRALSVFALDFNDFAPQTLYCAVGQSFAGRITLRWLTVWIFLATVGAA